MKYDKSQPGMIRKIKERVKRWSRAMPRRRTSEKNGRLGLRAGEWVEVRSQDEVLATLDERGCLEKVPFMPEMLQYCGQKFRVFKRSDKTCDPATDPWSIRRMKDSVHLEGVRCDGSGHGKCDAGCLIFWKEAWLKRVENAIVSVEKVRSNGTRGTARKPALCTVESILAASQTSPAETNTVYFCQGTQVSDFSSYMSAWDPRQYIRDLRSGNLASGLAGDSRTENAFEMMLGVIRLLRALMIPVFNRMQSKLDGARYPFLVGALEKTSVEILDLQVGELVQVRSKEEIMATLDKQNRNRGLLFDSEQVPYCGGIYRVARRVNQIVDERTGKLIYMRSPCIVLEGVWCQSDFHRLCPRAIYSYWREGWLQRVSAGGFRASSQRKEVADCQR